MAGVLNIITRDDAFVRELIANEPGEVVVFDLTQGEPDYDALLDAIFEAEKVRVF